MQDNLDKKSIHTLVGNYQQDNTFIDLEGNKYSVITYRQFNRMMKPNILVCVNIKWSISLNCWVIFQCVLLEDM